MIKRKYVKKYKELVIQAWIVENKDGIKISVLANSRSQARYMAVSEFYNTGKNPNVSLITVGENNV